MKINIILIVAIAIISFMLTGCGSDSNAERPTPQVSFSIIAAGQNPQSGTFENRKIEIFRDQESLNLSLSKYLQLLSEQHTIDFTSTQAVLINIGVRDTGGFSVKTESIEEFPSYIKMKIKITKPGQNCTVTGALTSPYEFIEIFSTKELIFEESLEIDQCI